MGDFNFADDSIEDNYLKTINFKDIWFVLKDYFMFNKILLYNIILFDIFLFL